MREPPGNLRKASVMFQVNMGAVKTKKSTNQSILFQTLQGENTEVGDAILHFAILHFISHANEARFCGFAAAPLP